MKTTILTVLAISWLVGCAAQKVQLSSTFDPDEVAFFSKPGTAQINGQAFLKTVGGDVKTAAGNQVALVPVSTYSRERMNAIYGAGNCSTKAVDFGPPDPQFERYIKNTTADGDGRFRFDNLSAGQYFVATTVSWAIPSGYVTVPQGCKIMKQVNLDEGQKLDIVMTAQ
jgi:hypothetical protein